MASYSSSDPKALLAEIFLEITESKSQLESYRLEVTETKAVVEALAADVEQLSHSLKQFSDDLAASKKQVISEVASSSAEVFKVQLEELSATLKDLLPDKEERKKKKRWFS